MAGALEKDKARAATGVMSFTVVALWFAGAGSSGLPLTTHVFVNKPPSAGWTTIVTLAPAPLVIVPNVHVIVPLSFVQLPLVLVTEIKIKPAGSESVRVTP